MKSMRPVRPQPRGGHVEAGQLASLDALEEGGPPVDLALVEAVGPAEVLEALGPPVDVAQQGDALDQLEGEAVRAPRDPCRTAPATRPWSSMGDQPSTKPIR